MEVEQTVPQVINVPRQRKHPDYKQAAWTKQFVKHPHETFQRIPIDDSIYGKNSQGYVIAHSSDYEKPLYVEDYVKRMNKKKGEEGLWKHELTDLDGDGYDDMVIYRDDKPMVWNGYHYVSNKPMIGREQFMQDETLGPQFGYSMKKYKFSLKSEFDQMLSNVAKSVYDQYKLAKVPKQVLNDLSTNTIKTIIKKCIIIPYFISTKSIPITLEQYKEEIAQLINLKNQYPDFKSSEASSLQAVFKYAKKNIFDNLTSQAVKELEVVIRQKINLNDISELYKKCLPFEKANKDKFCLQYIH